MKLSPIQGRNIEVSLLQQSCLREKMFFIPRICHFCFFVVRLKGAVSSEMASEWVCLRGVRLRGVRLCPAERKWVPGDPVHLPRLPRLLSRLLLVNRFLIERFVVHSKTPDTPVQEAFGVPAARTSGHPIRAQGQQAAPHPRHSAALLSSLGTRAESESSRNRPNPGPESPPRAEGLLLRAEAWWLFCGCAGEPVRVAYDPGTKEDKRGTLCVN